MRDSWVGLQAGVDARGWARLLRRAQDSAVNGGHVPAIFREVIAASWQHCSGRGLDGGPGPLLPDSTVPAIVAARERLQAAVREAAASRGG
jgi:hypothetical protein